MVVMRLEGCMLRSSQQLQQTLALPGGQGQLAASKHLAAGALNKQACGRTLPVKLLGPTHSADTPCTPAAPSAKSPQTTHCCSPMVQQAAGTVSDAAGKV